MLIETTIEDNLWHSVDLAGLSEQAAETTLKHLGLDDAVFEISILGCDDARIAALNGDFRGKNVPTNVLSWPSAERGAVKDGGKPEMSHSDIETELGDIAIAYDTCKREADEEGKSLSDHVTHLIVHAVLHLLGYDHIRDQDATLMQRCESEILGKLGLPDPYRDYWGE